MKRASVSIAAVAMAITACGLKVPVTVVAGSDTETGSGFVDPNAGGPGDLGAGVAGPDIGPGDTGVDVTGPGDTGVDPGVDAGSIFRDETEGITNNELRICAHVPITGAAPIPHHPARFGQFYFDYVNAELGGIYNRKVTFRAIDDQYYPAGARKAMTDCASQGSFIYFGAAGTDQIVSVAKWAEDKKVPYLHGPTSIADMGDLNYNVHAGPTYEYQHKLLARYLVNRYGKNVDYATIRVDSPFFKAGADAFRAELKALGVTLKLEMKVQKDESAFQNVFFELNDPQNPIEVVNNFTTPNIWIKMLNQKPANYDPTWTAVSPIAGFNIVANALATSGSKSVVFHHFNPACECVSYKDEEISQKKHLPWYPDIEEFLRVFKKYSPEKDPPPDDFDYASFLSARAIHRILLAIGDKPTRSKLWDLTDSYKERGAKAGKIPITPGCPADFTRSKDRIGGWNVNIFELTGGTWKQVAGCVDKV